MFSRHKQIWYIPGINQHNREKGVLYLFCDIEGVLDFSFPLLIIPALAGVGLDEPQDPFLLYSMTCLTHIKDLLTWEKAQRHFSNGWHSPLDGHWFSGPRCSLPMYPLAGALFQPLASNFSSLSLDWKTKNNVGFCEDKQISVAKDF